MLEPIWKLTATQSAAAIRKGEVSAEAVVTAHVERMRAVNPSINAVVVDLGDEAIASAKAADKAKRRGDELDLLHGVPVTLKQNVDVAGQANPNGVAAMNGLIAQEDSPVVRNLKGAGAIPIGLTNTPEFSLRAFTDNALHGLTLNPWDNTITCGGSSGGAAASLALGIGALAHGNDIGGSLRWPAHCNGVATIRPTLGRVPAYNPSANSERPLGAQMFSVQGPLARSVDDLRLALKVMSRRDIRDPWWVPAPLEGSKPKGPTKVALAEMPADMNPDPGVMALVNKAACHLEDEGYVVQPVKLPNLMEIWQGWADILINEIVVMQEATIRPITSDDFHAVLDAYKTFSNTQTLPDYMNAMADRTRHLRNWLAFLEEYPIILTPVFAHAMIGPRADAENQEQAVEVFRNGLRFVGVANYLGLPAAVVPVGLNNGHPVGVQLIASRFREDIALDAASAVEKHAGILTRQLWAR